MPLGSVSRNHTNRNNSRGRIKPTIAVQIRPCLTPFPGRRNARVLTQRLPGIAILLDVRVALHRRRSAGPCPRRVPSDRVAAHAVDLRALRPRTGRPAPAIRSEGVASLALHLVLPALLRSTFNDTGLGGWGGDGCGCQEQQGRKVHRANCPCRRLLMTKVASD